MIGPSLLSTAWVRSAGVGAATGALSSRGRCRPSPALRSAVLRVQAAQSAQLRRHAHPEHRARNPFPASRICRFWKKNSVLFYGACRAPPTKQFVYAILRSHVDIPSLSTSAECQSPLPAKADIHMTGRWLIRSRARPRMTSALRQSLLASIGQSGDLHVPIYPSQSVRSRPRPS